MIVDLDSGKMVSPSDSHDPPSYDLATSAHSGSDTGGSRPAPNMTYPADSKLPFAQPGIPASEPYAPGPSMPPTTVYYYIHPVTQEHITSLLPPDHPEMVCLQSGSHIPETKFGILGILAAVFWFPLGVGLCLLDRRVKCKRCGQTLESGLCD